MNAKDWKLNMLEVFETNAILTCEFVLLQVLQVSSVCSVYAFLRAAHLSESVY